MLQRLSAVLLAVSVSIAPAMAASDPNDVEGSKDPSVFGRMKHTHIVQYEEKEFGRLELPVNSRFDMKAVEGRLYKVTYAVNEGTTPPSGLQVTRNYANAAKAAGGKTVADFEDGGTQHLSVTIAKGGAEVWAYVDANGTGEYHVSVVEKEGMRQDVEADASALASGLKENGRVAVYGILFDTGKATIKPESAAALAEIAKLLAADPALKLYVVGHTDNVGAFEPNVKLSNARADAVVKELVGKHAVAAARLRPFGAGPTSPVASNGSEAGRAKNRRVELVAQ